MNLVSGINYGVMQCLQGCPNSLPIESDVPEVAINWLCASWHIYREHISTSTINISVYMCVRVHNTLRNQLLRALD